MWRAVALNQNGVVFEIWECKTLPILLRRLQKGAMDPAIDKIEIKRVPDVV
jgi:hypothetical protein